MRSTDSHQWRAGQAADQLPRLLPADSRTEPAGLAEHLARYGPLRSAGLNRQRREALIDEVDRSGLTGRGGAGFPVARKLAAVAAGHAPIVLANGTEGEPASSKDKVLLARSPQLVLDGAVLAAEIVGASQAVTVVHHSVREIVDAAAAERTQASADRVRIRVMTAADRFVAGEASAVVHWIEDSVPTPTRKPPRISERGLGGRPTLVHNVETLAHLALIARYGASWFRAVGTAQEPGSMLVTILGAVNHRTRRCRAARNAAAGAARNAAAWAARNPARLRDRTGRRTGRVSATDGRNRGIGPQHSLGNTTQSR